MKKRVIHWFRNDLRLADNPALYQASASDEVMPIYIVTPNAMSELGQASIIWLFALTIFLFVRKLRKPKPVDDIKLQKIHLMRLGPFSGQSNSFKGKSVVFMMLLSTLSYADVSIRTLDNFHIDDLSENELTVAKKAEDINDGTQLGFHIERPHCIPNYPYLMAEIPEELNKGDNIYDKMVVDKKKQKKTKHNLEWVY